MRTLQIDLVGPIAPQGEEGEEYVMTVIDMFTYWLWVIPLKTKLSAEVAETLFKQVYLGVGGFPTILRSDQGAEFVGRITRKMNELMGVDQVCLPSTQPVVGGKHSPAAE